ncbi:MULTISPECIES: 3-carboxyethylcatechol 2,3-dioxygenase [unclassified Acinetobacter]|uniref:3-carboxyethylcatechol 2,3-dioxygenase n=1 Tax=unclassified Acinetobacter TaxID=196816 RepID=UPI0018A954CC|nr:MULTISPECIES: 3-carboxyethylcatechol 2,3-dioxygenase [unclassified Acinetobacter]MBJ9955058.1 3-carboxyethylcatechol 2,3-dioxygenase [Acinetobacter baumannii]
MSVKLICVSHTPLLDFASPAPDVEASARAVFTQLADQVKAYDPTLIVIFGPDHFNGFFYDLMPAFCLGTRATAAGDWNYGPGTLNVPEAKALALADYCLAHDIDMSYSYRMQADHGITQPLDLFCDGQLDRYPVIPIFINSAANPLPRTQRVIQMGQIVGKYLKGLDERILIIGSGGLSHDPPTPQIHTASQEVQEFLIAGRNPSTEARQQRQAKVIAVGQGLAHGDQSLTLPLNPTWDKALLQRFKDADFNYLGSMTSEDILLHGGRGGQEIRTWMAAFSALSAYGAYHAEIVYYAPIQEWIAGMGMMTAEPLQQMTGSFEPSRDLI